MLIGDHIGPQQTSLSVSLRAAVAIGAVANLGGMLGLDLRDRAAAGVCPGHVALHRNPGEPRAREL
jgi:hypothetical protein